MISFYSKSSPANESMSNVTNPGSAIGEAIGKLIEAEIGTHIKKICKKNGKHRLVVTGDDRKKLLMEDKWKNKFDIDMVIFDEKKKPIIIIESKYLRYKKHMRDKGSWVCTAHSNLRRSHNTIRSSIAILIGDWTEGSKNLIKSAGTLIPNIPWDHLVNTLKKYGVDFEWGEKDRDKANMAWENFCKLNQNQIKKLQIELVSILEKELEKTINSILDNKSEQKIIDIELSMSTNVGTTHVYDFRNTEQLKNFCKKI